MTYRYNIFRFVYELVDILVSRLEYGLRGLATSHVLVPPPAKSHSFLVMTAEEKGGRTFYKPAYYLFSKTRERLSGYFAQGKDHLFLQNTQHCLLIAFADSTLVVGREDTIAEYHPHSFETLLALKAICAPSNWAVTRMSIWLFPKKPPYPRARQHSACAHRPTRPGLLAPGRGTTACKTA